MFLSKEIILERDRITFTKENLTYSIFERSKYESLIKGNVKVIIKGETLVITKIKVDKEPNRKNLEEIINRNFFAARDKLFHHLFDKRNNILIIYSVEKPLLLNAIIERANIRLIMPYEVLLLKKLKNKIKEDNMVVFFISNTVILVLGLLNKNLIFVKKYSEYKIELLKSALKDYRNENRIDRNISVVFEGETTLISNDSMDELIRSCNESL